MMFLLPLKLQCLLTTKPSSAACSCQELSWSMLALKIVPAVCSAVLLHGITEVEHPNSGETTRRRWTNLLVSMDIPTHVDVLCYIDNIRWFACIHGETGNLLPGAAALQKKLMHCGWANVRKKNHRFFLKMRINIHSHLIQLNAWLSFFKMI